MMSRELFRYAAYALTAFAAIVVIGSSSDDRLKKRSALGGSLHYTPVVEEGYTIDAEAHPYNVEVIRKKADAFINMSKEQRQDISGSIIVADILNVVAQKAHDGAGQERCRRTIAELTPQQIADMSDKEQRRLGSNVFDFLSDEACLAVRGGNMTAEQVNLRTDFSRLIDKKLGREERISSEQIKNMPLAEQAGLNGTTFVLLSSDASEAINGKVLRAYTINNAAEEGTPANLAKYTDVKKRALMESLVAGAIQSITLGQIEEMPAKEIEGLSSGVLSRMDFDQISCIIRGGGDAPKVKQAAFLTK